jgi:hypothetical protein
MLNPGTTQNARNHEELNQFLLDINTLPEGANPDDFENIKSKKISDFLKSERSVGINGEDFALIIKDAKFDGDSTRIAVIKNFLISERSLEINVEDFVEIIKSADVKGEIRKLTLMNIILESQRLGVITSKNFVEIIKSAKFNDDEFKLLSIKNFLSSEKSSGVNCNDFVEIIKSVEFKDYEYAKFFLIVNFLESKRSEGINIEDFALIIKNVELKPNIFKYELIRSFLKNRLSNPTHKDLAKIIKEVGLQNQADTAVNLYVKKFSASENYIENFIDFTKVLQPNEAMQCEFVKEFIENNQINQDNVMGLKPFIEGLQDNELALDIINNLSGKGILVNAKDTLSLVKNRSKKQYAFLTEIVGDKTLNDCITETRIRILKEKFGEELNVDNQLITVSDLISYYDMVNQTSTLFAMLKPEFKKQLRDNFSPSAEMLLYKPTELEKLNSLLGQRGIEFESKNYFVENAKLCDYLKEKVGNVEEIKSDKTYQINFTNFGIEEEKQAELNTLFNELLKSNDPANDPANDPDKEKVAKFFSDLLGIDLSDIDGDKLKAFFQENKKELAHCFCDKELSKEDFKSLFTTIRDGCFANIGAQFKKMLYGAMIKDEDAQILYAVADDKIFSGIINNHGSDIMVDNFNPINNAIIKSYYLSPMALVTKTSQEEMLTNQKTWEIIGKIAGDDKKIEIYDKLSESYSDTTIFNQKAKEIASFLIVKEIVGEEKIRDLTSKNPQLKKLGDFVLDLGVEDISQSSQGSQQDVSSPQSSPRVQEDGSPAPRVNCLNLFSLIRCWRGQ